MKKKIIGKCHSGKCKGFTRDALFTFNDKLLGELIKVLKREPRCYTVVLHQIEKGEIPERFIGVCIPCLFWITRDCIKDEETEMLFKL